MGWKEHIKQHGRSTQKSAVMCRNTQVVSNTSSSHHMSAADSHWMQWMHSSPLFSLNRAFSWREDCSHFSADMLKVKAEDTIITPELELWALSWQEGKYYWSNGKEVCNILRSRLKNGVDVATPSACREWLHLQRHLCSSHRAFSWMNHSCVSEVLLPVPAGLYKELQTNA